MAVTLNASTSTGLVQSADNSGVIQLQSNGTTALTVNTISFNNGSLTNLDVPITNNFNLVYFVDGRGVNNGQIGQLYGIDIYVTSNSPVIETDAQNTATAGGDIKAAILAHKDTMVLAEQMSVRSQTQYKQEYLSTLYTADTLYGVKVVRPETGFVLAVNA